jgi:hypothetical protein
MKRTSAALWIAALALGAGIPAYAAGPHSHEAHANAAYPAQDGLSLDQGRKWTTDETLRRYMEEIRASLEQNRDAILSDRLTPEQEKALARTIESRVAAIVTDCKLEPRADANLHLVVAELVQAADILHGKATVERRHGAVRAIRATQMYATYFDHPDWNPIF